MSAVDYETLTRRMKDLQTFLNKFLDIERMVYLPDTARKDRLETDTEHPYHLAMHAWFLCQSFPELNQEKVLKYALAHDLVEIYAGDVMAIGRTDAEQKQKEDDEAAALRRIKKEWPDFVELTDYIENYEKQSDPESVFVKALDKLMPTIQQVISKGKSWKMRDMKLSHALDNKASKTAASHEIHAIWQELKAEITAHPEWFNKGRA